MRTVVVMLAVLAGVPALLSAAEPAAFFPSRPTGTSIQVSEGTLMQYGVGMKSGLLTLQDAGGKAREIYIGSSMRINGNAINCLMPPTEKIPNRRPFCTDWPSALQLGRSSVRVSYWVEKIDGKDVWVSDQIDF
jgi:hypothetical protein